MCFSSGTGTQGLHGLCFDPTEAPIQGKAAGNQAIKHPATRPRPPSKAKGRRPSKVRKQKPTPNLDAYVNGKHQQDSSGKKMPLVCDKMACVIASVTRHYREELRNGMITESCLENMWC